MPDLSFAFLTTPEGWAAMLTLIAMEVVLGIDNLIFISILTNKLPARTPGEGPSPRHRRRSHHAATTSHDDLVHRGTCTRRSSRPSTTASPCATSS